MHRSLNDYRDIVGDKTVNSIYGAAEPLAGKYVGHLNSTHYGGGVAEILNTLVPLMNDVGINAGWRVLKGSPEFFTVTKKMHNSLQGDNINLSRMKKKVYVNCNEHNSSFTHFEYTDIVIIHDPQPLPFINFEKKKQPWIWRCHIDISKPYMPLWNYLKKFVARYDAMVVSSEKFKKRLKIPTYLIPPSIDPLNTKNEEVSERTVERFLAKKGIDLDKPVIAQISRYDKWKDPLGVIKAFDIIRKKVDCRLVLLGSMATDDPEGTVIYNEVLRKANHREDITILTEENDFLVNCLQRGATVVMQKSLKEGFGLTVSEALWKETPVVAGAVGGIPLQIINGKTGYLSYGVKDAAKKTLKLLEDEKLRKNIGRQGKEHVGKNFLITRHLLDWLKVMKEVTA